MVGKIFINYRRDDDPMSVRALRDRLVRVSSRKRLFINEDVDLGLDFVNVLGEQIEECDIMISVIGPRWLDARDEDKRRLDDPDDFVRIEIESALKQGKRVIPVLLGEARMPSADELPDSTQRQAVRLIYDRFGAGTPAYAEMGGNDGTAKAYLC
jgi:hypothetical protein